MLRTILSWWIPSSTVHKKGQLSRDSVWWVGEERLQDIRMPESETGRTRSAEEMQHRGGASIPSFIPHRVLFGAVGNGFVRKHGHLEMSIPINVT